MLRNPAFGDKLPLGGRAQAPAAPPQGSPSGRRAQARRQAEQAAQWRRLQEHLARQAAERQPDRDEPSVEYDFRSSRVRTVSGSSWDVGGEELRGELQVRGRSIAGRVAAESESSPSSADAVVQGHIAADGSAVLRIGSLSLKAVDFQERVAACGADSPGHVDLIGTDGKDESSCTVRLYLGPSARKIRDLACGGLHQKW